LRRSTERILTTHVGSLPRPQPVVDLLFAQDRGEPLDAVNFDAVMADAVVAIVRQQRSVGVDVVSDGETSKISYATYIRHRLTGFEGDSARPTPQDLDDYPDYRDRLVKEGASAKYLRPVCRGPIAVKDLGPVERDIAHLQAALRETGAEEGFLNAVSPGTIAVFQPDEHYGSYEAYLAALAEAMRAEYRRIVESGLLLQIDCPDLAMGRHSRFKHESDEAFLRLAALQIEALNHALEGLPPDRMRLHVCWGNYEGPHTHDLALEKILPLLFEVRPAALLIEGANARHEHEWEIWREARLPDDKILVPGVLDSCSNVVEHPRLVAQRIIRFAELVGRERVIAGTDCGFGTFAGFGPVHPLICWEKLRALAEGARLASEYLF
jgi:5-methyltetrahydropteroyltriglutamate--homocysteine methyltransferase